MSYLFSNYAFIYDTFMHMFQLDGDHTILSFIPSKRSRILDIGGGTGKIADQLVKRGHQVTILDPCKRMTDIAKKRNSKIRIIGRAMPFYYSKTYQIILIRDCLHHIKETKKVLEDAIRMLEPGGRIIIADFNPNTFEAKLIYLFERCCLEKVYPISKQQVAQCLRLRGLSVNCVRISKRDYVVVGKKKGN